MNATKPPLTVAALVIVGAFIMISLITITIGFAAAGSLTLVGYKSSRCSACDCTSKPRAVQVEPSSE